MPENLAPNVGDWYQSEEGATFEVVAHDEDAGHIEIQYFDGTVEELDSESWHELRLDWIEPPEDFSGSMDLNPEDYALDLGPASHVEWNNPLDDLDR